MLQLYIILVLLLFSPVLASATIYSYQAESGTHHFTNIKPPNKKYTIIISSFTRKANQDSSFDSSTFDSNVVKSKLIDVAMQFLGTPYQLGGEDKRGFDCSGFVREIFRLFGYRLPRTSAQQYQIGQEVNKKDLAVGDLVFFRTRLHSERPTHVGIFIGNDKFIHSSSIEQKGVRINSLESTFYSKTYVGAKRVREDFSD